MDGLTAFRALGSMNGAASVVPPDHTGVAAAAPRHGSQTQTPATPDAAAIAIAPSMSPSVEQANIEKLPLAIKYAPSAVPPDISRAAKFDRSA
jgi:hypothetical protein